PERFEVCWNCNRQLLALGERVKGAGRHQVIFEVLELPRSGNPYIASPKRITQFRYCAELIVMPVNAVFAKDVGRPAAPDEGSGRIFWDVATAIPIPLTQGQHSIEHVLRRGVALKSKVSSNVGR